MYILVDIYWVDVHNFAKQVVSCIQYVTFEKKTNFVSRLTLNSQAPTLMPWAAPDPESPMKCSVPMLLTNREAPI